MKKNKTLIIAVSLTIVFLLMSKKASGSYTNILSWLIPEFESFSSTPYWDVSRYSWGYGTAAPGSTGTITRAQAFQDMTDHFQDDYNYLQPLISRILNPGQWAALLSFSYNEGQGNADNLVSNINSNNDQALHDQWLLYNKVRDDSGSLVYNQTLADRRAREWQVWQGYY